MKIADHKILRLMKKASDKILFRRVAAFSLIEAAFAMLLIGVFTAALFPFYNLIHFKENVAITRYRANYVRKAVQGYVARFGMLPYATDENLENGLEKTGMTIGAIPYKTLGIPKQYAYDGFGKKFKYIVNEHLCLGYWKRKEYEPGKCYGVIPSTLPVQAIMTCVQFSNPYYLKPFFVSFQRIYAFEKMVPASEPDKTRWKELDYRGTEPYDETTQWYRIKRCDNMHNLNKLHLMYGSKKVIDNVGKIYMHFVNMFQNLSFYQGCFPPWDFMMLNHDRYPENTDVLAWAVISGKQNCVKQLENGETHINLNSRNMVFWQSRFNLAAQIKHPCTTLPMDWSSELYCLYENRWLVQRPLSPYVRKHSAMISEYSQAEQYKVEALTERKREEFMRIKDSEVLNEYPNKKSQFTYIFS